MSSVLSQLINNLGRGPFSSSIGKSPYERERVGAGEDRQLEGPPSSPLCGPEPTGTGRRYLPPLAGLPQVDRSLLCPRVFSHAVSPPGSFSARLTNPAFSNARLWFPLQHKYALNRQEQVTLPEFAGNTLLSPWGHEPRCNCHCVSNTPMGMQ